MSVFCLQMIQGNENMKCTLCSNSIYNAISKKKPIVSKRLAKILKAFSAFSFEILPFKKTTITDV